jgi:hypothetical protein
MPAKCITSLLEGDAVTAFLGLALVPFWWFDKSMGVVSRGLQSRDRE